jgi:hypothetical protein
MRFFNRKRKNISKKDVVSSPKISIKNGKQFAKQLTANGKYENQEVKIAESSRYIERRRLRKQRIELEIVDGERATNVKCKIVDGYMLEFKFDGKKQRKIIGTRPRTAEYKVLIFYRRVLKWYIGRFAEVTHDPEAGALDLPQAKFAMELVNAVVKYRTFVELAKANKGKNTKELIIWVVALVVLGGLGMLTNAGYFK